MDEPGLSLRPGRIHAGLNSGYQAVGLAFMWGAAQIVLLGYDFMRGPNGESHHHGDHEGGLPNLGTLDEWVERMGQLALELRACSVEVVNASPRTALECFIREPIRAALESRKPALLVHGMSGMGDNLHQRALLKELCKHYDVWLRTPWPQIYHDMPHVRPIPINTKLRTQAKNEKRWKYYSQIPPRAISTIRITYSPPQIMQLGSVLASMWAQAGLRGTPGDFRLPVPQEWRIRAREMLGSVDKPIMVYRPLVERVEWTGSKSRNPEYSSYAALYRSLRDKYHVVSIADLVPDVEWTVGERVEVDQTFHAGEFQFEALAGLFAEAALVYSCPGFAVVLAQAVGTPAITVFGGFEDARSFSAGARFTPWLAVEPINPCPCWSHTHNCNKKIDVPNALKRIKEFINVAATDNQEKVNQYRRTTMLLASELPAPIFQRG